MMKKILSLLAVVFLLSSCLNSEDPSYTVSLSSVGYNHVTSFGDNTTKLTASSYDLAMDLGKMTMNIGMKINLGDGNDQVELYLNDIKISYGTDALYVFSASEIVPEKGGSADPNYTITNLKGKMWAYYTSDGSSTREVIVLTLSYIVNGKYSVFTVDNQPTFVNNQTTTTCTSADIPAYTTATTTYAVKMTSTSKADVTIYNAQFNSQMPQLTMTLKDVPVVLTSQGYELKAESIVPQINDTPFEQYKMNDFRLQVISQGTEMYLSFNCNVMNASYTVAAHGYSYIQANE